LEISHRSKEFEEVVAETESLVRELLNVPENYSVLFLQGGASQQFAMIPMNLLPEGGKAAYLDTGVWASKAAKEAKNFGQIEIVASSKDSNYTYIPKDFEIPRMQHTSITLQITQSTVQKFLKNQKPLSLLW
ncbi:MAG TPA: aminotransferase class V-fold PLP-dependent enzyme, partial [Sphingobacterium bovisgrunnientis]|nr:aminotransferase class V-fold PLP-dependent enzyme [Sphingobacterium bovisgrunnientis]